MKIFESFVDLINDKSFIKNNIAFIPTMGHLHAGHMSLIKNAENFSKNILKNMSYLNTKSTNFTSNSGKMIINLINNYER